MNESPNLLPQRLIHLAQQVQSVFHDASQMAEQYGQKSGLTCPPTCGQCCDNPSIEATVLEFLPFAIACWEDGTFFRWHQKLLDYSDMYCPFFVKHPEPGLQGRCTQYQWRPSLCRLFGFAARRDKTGEYHHVACNIHKEYQESSLLKARILCQEQAAPTFQEFALQLMTLDPTLGVTRKPIYRALREAFEYVGLCGSYMHYNNFSDPVYFFPLE